MENGHTNYEDHNAERLMQLSATLRTTSVMAPLPTMATPITSEAVSSGQILPPAIPTVSPFHKMLKRHGFKYASGECATRGDAHGYAHKDGRAALLVMCSDTVEWTTRWPDGAEVKGNNELTFDEILGVTTAKRTHNETRIKSFMAHEASVTTGAKAVMAAVKPGRTLPGGPPDHAMRAIEMLGAVTSGKYDFTLLRGDGHYSDRMALIRVLLGRERGQVKSAEVGLGAVRSAFFSSLAVPNSPSAAAAKLFTARCVELITAWKDARAKLRKAEKRIIATALRASALDRAVPGIILPTLARKSKSAAKLADKAAKEALATELVTAAPEQAIADPDATLPWIDLGALRGIVYRSGAHGLILERRNSQGALHVVDNGHRISVSVLTPTLAMGTKSMGGQEEFHAMLEALEASKSARTPRAAEALAMLRRATDAAVRPLSLTAADLSAKAPRDGADEPVLHGARLLEDKILGPVALRLERVGSQGALAVYNDGTRLTVGVVPSEVLRILRPVPGVDAWEAAKQLLEPAEPGVPMTQVAAHHLAAVIDRKETDMSDNASVKEPKFAAKGAVKKAIKQPSKKAVKAPAKKAVAGPGVERKTSLFRLKNDTKKEWSGYTGQKADIIAAFEKAGAVGSKALGITRGALIAALPNVPAANISFYLSKWQAPGVVEKLAAAV